MAPELTFDPGRHRRPSVADTPATRAVAADAEIARLSQEELIARIRDLRREREAVILAHNYEIGPIQDIADYVGDSLQLSQQAAATDAPLIAFCGVHFMAETAKILSPKKTVLIPDTMAGCSLADTVTPEQVRKWRKEHPDHVIVAYVNTSAAVKAEVDYCCTSSNAAQVVNAVPEGKEILFLPDMFLGAHVRRMTGRENIHVWMGECHVHAGIDPEHIALQRAAHPGAEFLIHPECGCATNVVEAVSAGDVDPTGVQILSTEGMIKRPAQSDADTFIVATEIGILHRLRKANPAKRFIPASDRAMSNSTVSTRTGPTAPTSRPVSPRTTFLAMRHWCGVSSRRMPGPRRPARSP